MKRFLTIVLAIAVFITLTLGVSYAATPGGADDPLISLSFISGYITKIINKGVSLIDLSFNTIKTLMNTQLEAAAPPQNGMSFASGNKILPLKSGGTVTVMMGSSVSLISGTIKVTSLSGTLINVSDGTVTGKADEVKTNNRYFAAENTSVTFTVYSSTANVAVDGYYKMTESGTLPDVRFDDVPGHWAEEYINYLSAAGIVNGMEDRQFWPDYTMTRGMFVTIIGRLYGADKNSYKEAKFKDVDYSSWYGPYVAWAAEKGIVNGFEDGTFLPNSTITREQMAVIIMRYADFCGAKLTGIKESAIFPDDSLIGSWAKDSVYLAQKAGLITGRTDNTFDPKGTATRAEVCTIVFRLIKAINT